MRDYLHTLYFALKALLCFGFATYASLHGQPHDAFLLLKVGLASFWIGCPIFALLDTIALRSTAK